jgi:hypothetical protein
MNPLKTLILAASTVGAIVAAPASAATLLTYAQFLQTSNVKAFNYDAQADRSVISVGGTGTILIGLDFLISDPVGTMFPTTFTMTATSFDPVISTGIQFEQGGFSGTISFQAGSTDVLTLNFSNAIFNYAFGNPASASLIVDCFCGITYTSDVFSLPEGGKDFSLGINAVTGPAWSEPLAKAGSYFGADFTANVVGTFAAVPEAGTWTMLIAGFGMVGFAARRRKTAVAA